MADSDVDRALKELIVIVREARRQLAPLVAQAKKSKAADA